MGQPLTGPVPTQDETRTGLPLGAWVWANTLGLGSAYGLFALFGDTADALGADHGILHGIAATIGLLAGGSLFVRWRQRVLAKHSDRSTWLAAASGAGLAVGFIVGSFVAGPPLDFLLGTLTLGTIGGGLQWQVLRSQLTRPGRLLIATIAAWLAAGVAVTAFAVVVGDTFFAAIGQPEDLTLPGIASFTFFLAVLGAFGGAVGGALEGRALRRELRAG